MHVLATAGHVDHGKSTLVRALTGTDPDRLAEEKARGLTIDLGFASTQLPSGRALSFVDVPGHVRFLKNMLAGVGAVDACLFVVAATEGWKPQSEEHLRILELLGVQHGLVVMTKAAVAGDDLCHLCRAEVAERVQGSFLERRAPLAVDSCSGQGLDELEAALDDLLAATPSAADTGRPRLWLDRVFSVRGAGTVVTGTLAGGAIAVDDELAVVPGPGLSRRPAPVRVRALQSHGRPLDVAGPGRRLAVNLGGVDTEDLWRGQALVRPGQFEPSATVDAALQVLASLGHPVTRRGAFQLHVGSGAFRAQLRVLGAPSLEPGSAGCVRLHLPLALPLLPGDRYVLRELGRGETVGGGEILDVAPVLPAARARPDRSVERVVAERGWVDADLLERLTGERRAPIVGRWVVDRQALDRTEGEVRRAVADAGPLGLDVRALEGPARALAELLPDLVVEAGRVRDAAGGQDEPDLCRHPFVLAAEAAPFAPPDPRREGVEPAVLAELVRRGILVECGGIWFARSAIDRATEVVAGLLLDHADGISASEVRAALGTTRRFVLPLLVHLDGSGVTRRRGDLRVAGPRLPVVQG